MNDAMPEDLPARWFEYWRRLAGTREERKALELGQPAEVQAAHDWVGDRIEAGGSAAIDAMVLLAEAASSEDEEAMVGIGPVEDLIYEHGDGVVDLLVDRARRTPALVRTLAYVSLGSGAVSDVSLAKLQRLAAEQR